MFLLCLYSNLVIMRFIIIMNFIHCIVRVYCVYTYNYNKVIIIEDMLSSGPIFTGYELYT